MLQTLLAIAALSVAFKPCLRVASLTVTAYPTDCADLNALVDWVKQAVFSIVAVFAVRSLPLFKIFLNDAPLFRKISNYF